MEEKERRCFASIFAAGFILIGGYFIYYTITNWQNVIPVDISGWVLLIGGGTPIILFDLFLIMDIVINMIKDFRKRREINHERCK